mmetsp:Transcript_56612/g.104791  ORF Transcript_56612/g.104791 Transcript_56612/m.104791 type:complete len:178 (-) Transcript_56612:128-661(-)
MGNTCCTQEDEAPSSTDQDRYHHGLVDLVDATTLAPQSELAQPKQSGGQQADSVAALPVLAARREEGGESETQKSAPKDVPDANQEDERMYVTIVRVSQEEKLGVDLKHCEGYLLVKHIYEDFAAARHAARGGGLKVGDKIYAVNLVDTDLNKMVEECKNSVSVRFQITRPQYPEAS